MSPCIRHPQPRSHRHFSRSHSTLALTSAPHPRAHLRTLHPPPQVAAVRLRRAATSRQSLLSRFEEQAAHTEKMRRLTQQRLTERLDLRKSAAAAVHAARAAAQAEVEHRATVRRSREEECARQAEKARQQMVQRVAYHFKQALATPSPHPSHPISHQYHTPTRHTPYPISYRTPTHHIPHTSSHPHVKQALAKATAVKEGRKESLEIQQERMLSRLGAAEMRRKEIAEEVRVKETAAGRQGGQASCRGAKASKVSHMQRLEQREASLRAEQAQLTMAAAAKRREEAIERVSLQARLAPTKESNEAEKDRAEAVDTVRRRRALFARLNAADQRRGLFLWRRVRESRLTSMRKATQAMAATVIVVDVDVVSPAAADPQWPSSWPSSRRLGITTSPVASWRSWPSHGRERPPSHGAPADVSRWAAAAFKVTNRRISSLVVSLDKPAKPLAKPAVVDDKAAAAAVAAAVAAACRPLGVTLLARLLARPERSAVLHKSRELTASYRHALALKAIRTKAARSAERAAAAARTRAARVETMRAAHQAKMSAAAARTQGAAEARLVARATRAIALSRAVAAARAVSLEAELTRLDKAVARHLEAAARRGARLEQARSGGARRAAARAFAARRFAQDLAASQRGVAQRVQCATVASRRAALLSARVAKAARMAIPRGTTPAQIEHRCALLGIEAVAWPASWALKAWAESEVAFNASPLIEVCAMGLEVVGSKALLHHGLLVRQQAAWRRKGSTLYPGPVPRLVAAVVAAAEAQAFYTASADEFCLLEDEDDENDEDDYEYDDEFDYTEVVVDDDEDDEDDDDDDDNYSAVVAAARRQSYPQATSVPSQGPRLSLDWKFLFQAQAAEKQAEGERQLAQSEEGWLLV